MNHGRDRRAWPALPLPRTVRRSLRKWASGWLALLLVLQTWIPIATAADLTDTQGHWAEAEIENLVDEGIVKGYQDGSFRPDAPITRAEFVTLLNRTAGAQPAGETANFPDVTPVDWFAADVALAAAARTVNGFQDGSFRPQQPITRQEAAVVLARVLDLSATGAPTFADGAAIPAWAAPGVAAVAAAGFMKGYPDATFGGEKPITRAEAATLLQRTRMRMLLTMPRRVALTVTDEQGTAVSGATVRIHKQGQQAYLASGLTGADGQLVRYLRAGEYTMTAVAGGLAGFTNEKVLPGAATVAVTLSGAATFSGVVVDEAQQPVPGALVSLTTNPTFLTVTGADGRFSAAVPGGRDYQFAVAYFEDGQTRFGQNLDEYSDFLPLLDNLQAQLPSNAPRPRVTKVTPGATAPQGGTADLGQMNGATGQRTGQPGGNNPPPGGNNPPPGGNNPPPGGGNPPNGGGNPPGGGGNPPPPAPTLQSLTITPAEATLGIGQTQAFTLTGIMSDNTAADTTKATFTVTPAGVASMSATGTVTALAEGTATVTATLGTKTATAGLTVVSLAGPAIDPTVASDIATSTAFLYTGTNPIQTGVANDTIDAERVAVLRGKVTTRDGKPLPGVTITILNHAEYGQTRTRVDGMFDFAVNGGGQVTVQYNAEGYLAAQRTTVVPWQDFVWMPEVTLIPADTKVTEIDLSTPTTEVQVAQGSTVTDEAGTRTATVLFMPGTTATMTMPDGTEAPLETLSVRATEYTVGTGGPASMPGELPPTSAYTYALELSVDEAMDLGATSVNFNQPVPFYVDNFRGFDVGEVVPMGYYDRAKAAWVGSENGRVIKIISETDGMADIDTDGDGVADNDPALGITDAERARLAELYEPGQELWRVPITHFTPWDCNWPYGPPEGAYGPNRGPTPRTPSDKKCTKAGSIIECQNQILGEAVNVTGTPFTLHYQSDRTPGGSQEAYTIDIPITGSNPHDKLMGVQVRVTVAGRSITERFGPAPNQNYTFTWDGKDAYGRKVQGEVQAKVEVGYTYRLVYYSSPRSFTISWAIPGVSPMATRNTDPEVTLWRDWTTTIGAWDASAVGLGGWTISAHHAYDPSGQAVYYGNGERRHLTGVNLINTVAGNGLTDEYLDTGNGNPATQAMVASPTTVAVAPDGTLYIGQGNRIRKVDSAGIITHYAGGLTLGDGGPAASASLKSVNALAVGPDGSLYIADTVDHRLRRITPDGMISTAAGTGVSSFTPDGALANTASLDRPTAVAVAPDGTIYIAERGSNRIRRIGTDGILTTFAGTGEAGSEGDGGPAVASKFGEVFGLALGPDGSLYVADRGYSRIRKVTPDGLINTVAGNGMAGYDGDGVPATEARLNSPQGLAVTPNGVLYISDSLNGRVRMVGHDGIITTLAGTGIVGFSGDGGPAARARMGYIAGIAAGPDGYVYVADNNNHRIRRIESPMAASAGGEWLVPSEDGREVYAFDGAGRHMRTLDGLTGALRYRFDYNAAGQLVAITDVFGNQTQILRDAGGKPVAILAPGLQRTSLTVGANGYISAITNPAGEAIKLTYQGQGLLKTYTSPEGGVWRFTFDDRGRLTKDEDPLGGYKELVRTDAANGFSVAVTTAEGLVTTYRVEALSDGRVRRTQTDPAGAQTVLVLNPDSTRTVTYPNGVVATVEEGPDPRWGMLVPIVAKVTVTSPDGVTSTYSRERLATLGDLTDPLSVKTMLETVTTNDGVVTIAYDRATQRVVTTTAEGRQSQVVLNAQGLIVEETDDLAASVAPAVYVYDARGRLESLSRGDQVYTYTYDERHRLITRTDAAGNLTQYGYDDADRLVRTVLPGTGVVRYEYDDDGNPTKVYLPSGDVHTISYTKTGLATGYTPPGSAAFTYGFNKDKARTDYALPGDRSQTFIYDTAGRLIGTTFDEAALDFTYTDETERVSTITRTPVQGTGSQAIAYGYDGDLVMAMAYTGLANGQYTYRYGNGFMLSGITLDNGPELEISRDKDGLITGYGPFTITRGGPEGAPSQIADGTLTIDYTYLTAALDNQAPSWPAGSTLHVTRATPLTLTLEWTAAADNVAVTGYRLYRGDELAATLLPGTRTYTVAGLQEDSPYSFRVEAVDLAGNWTTDGPTLSARTTVNAPPVWPDGSVLEASAVTPGSLTLTWTAADDDIAVSDYRVYQGDTVLAVLGSDVNTYAVTGLAGDTAYTFRVQAGDRKGLWSADLPLTVRTLADQPPTWPAGSVLTASGAGSTSLTLEWTAAADDLAVTRYVIRMNGAVRRELPGHVTKAPVMGLAPTTEYQFQMEACDRTGTCVPGPSTQATTPAAAGLAGELITVRASRGIDGAEPNNGSDEVVVSDDGSMIIFVSDASNLVEGDTNGFQDLFVLDRANGGTIERVSMMPKRPDQEEPDERAHYSGINGFDVSGDGRYILYTTQPSNYGSANAYRSDGLWSYDTSTGDTVEVIDDDIRDPSVSYTGRFVVYERVDCCTRYWELHDRDADGDGIFDEVAEPNAVTVTSLPGASSGRISADGNWIVYTKAAGSRQVMVYERATGAEKVVSTSAEGINGNYDSYSPEVSADGRFVLFFTTATNLGVPDYSVVLHDRDADGDGLFDEPGAVSNRYVDRGLGGEEADSQAEYWRLSSDGRYVVFTSRAGNLVEGDTNYRVDVFIYDQTTGKTMRVSRSAAGMEADYGTETPPDVSRDGTTVAYASFAGTLVADDTNGDSDIYYTEWIQPVAPTWPSGSALTASNITAEGLTLTWTAAQDNLGVTSYEVYEGVAKLGTVGADVFTFDVSGLSPSTAYTFQVQAGDPGGNLSGDGPMLMVTTAPDTTPPALRSAYVIDDKLTMIYSEQLDVSSVPATDDLALLVAGAAMPGAIRAVLVAGDEVRITLQHPVAADVTVSLTYTAGSSPIRDTFSNPAAGLLSQSVNNLTGDLTAPQLDGLDQQGPSLILMYNEDLDRTSVPDVAAFRVYSGGGDEPTVYPVTAVAIHGSTVTLTVDTHSASPWNLFVDYTEPDSKPIRDIAGNAAVSFERGWLGDGDWETVAPKQAHAEGTARLATPPALSAPTLGAAASTDSPAPNLANGQFASRVHTVDAQEVYNLNLTWDVLGRITARTETVAGVTHTYDYTYDANGQLLTVTKDGTLVEAYTYDLNGNRKTQQTYGGAQVTATYDRQDRITALGAVAYTFDPAGFLTQRGNDTFVYSTRGELLKATLAGGATITYGYDGFGRRVTRTDANGTYQYLYGNPGNPFQVTDVRDPAGKLTTYFYDDAGILYAMQRDGIWYYIAADQVGTPRVITNTDGQVVKTLEFDSFGVLRSDSAPGFDLPFGYAGGLADQATGLVRFGFRDYDPAAGRWTASDPILFNGGQVNLYVYVGNNPISLQDPTGLFCIGGSAYAGVGGGIKVCIDEDGMGVCGEVGFGVGAGVEVEPMSGPEDGSKIKAEGKCQLGPMGAGAGGNFSECGFQFDAKLCGGPVCVKANSDGDVTMQADSYEFGVGCDAKLAGEVCGKW